MLEIAMTIVIMIAAGAAFDFFDPLAGAAPVHSARAVAGLPATEVLRTRDPLEFIKETGADYFRERRFAAALAMFDWAIALAPDDAESYAWRGFTKLQAGEYIKAQADYRKVLELKPGDFDGHSALCWAYGESQDYAQAVPHCDQALQQAQSRFNYALALENWCWLQVEMGDYMRAAKTCRFSLAYAPEYESLQALANYNMGRVLLAQGRTGEALAHFQAALRIGSTYPKMYLEIGKIYDRLGNHSSAQSSYAMFRQLFGGDAGRGQASGSADG